MRVFGLLSALLYAVHRAVQPAAVERRPAERKRATIPARFCGLPHLIATGEPVAHSCHVLPARALAAEAAGQSYLAARIMARSAAAGPLVSHPGLWRTRRR